VIVGFMFWGRTACGTLLGAYLSALRTLVERSPLASIRRMSCGVTSSRGADASGRTVQTFPDEWCVERDRDAEED